MGCQLAMRGDHQGPPSSTPLMPKSWSTWGSRQNLYGYPCLRAMEAGS